ncbi:MAG: hypothetical protein ACOH1O_03690 [Flavobacterium sp.]
MKNTVKKLGLLFMAVSIFSACTKDDAPTAASSSFVLKATDFQGKITDGDVTLDPNVVYKLTGSLTVADGAKLIIPAGTVIEGTVGTSYIAVAQGGKIFVNGTAQKPVVMTSGAAIKAPGQWGGLVICGKAPINKGLTASAEVSELTYGGTNSDDNSGSISYLRIEYSGYAYNSEKEFNGLSLFGVGKGTTVEYVQVYQGADDGFEFFGGTVDTRYLVSTSNEDDQFDWTEGWNGTNEFWFGKLGLGRGNRGIEADNNSNNHMAQPISNPSIKNLTLIGLGDQGTESQGLKLRVGTKGIFENVVLSNFVTGIDIQHTEGIGYVTSQEIKVSGVRFVNVTSKAKGKDTAGTTVDVSNVYTENSSANGAGDGENVPTWAASWIRL